MFKIRNPNVAGIVQALVLFVCYFAFVVLVTRVRGPMLFGTAIGVGVFGFFQGRKSALKRLESGDTAE